MTVCFEDHSQRKLSFLSESNNAGNWMAQQKSVTYLPHYFLLSLIIVRPLDDFERDICGNPARGVQQIHPVDVEQVLRWSCYFWSRSALLVEEIVHGTAKLILG